ncbi:MAG: cupredoxin family copper-binding protein [Chitinophagaceae bacterium]|nr:cupredoxin family copper-binding protein [Chitinophagaceae bacterium]
MKNKIILFLTSLMITGAIIYGCNKSDGSNPYGSNNNNNNNNNGGNNNTSSSISITGMSFSSTTVKAGTTVTWTNNDNVAHTVTADDGSFNSGNLAVGGTFSHKFSTAGTFNYHCEYHSMMKASVTVN